MGYGQGGEFRLVQARQQEGVAPLRDLRQDPVDLRYGFLGAEYGLAETQPYGTAIVDIDVGRVHWRAPTKALPRR